MAIQKPRVREELRILNVGKVFSTGVASQHLTEGMKELYKGKGAAAQTAQCMRFGKNLISEYRNKIGISGPDDKKLREYTESIMKACIVENGK